MTLPSGVDQQLAFKAKQRLLQVAKERADHYQALAAKNADEAERALTDSRRFTLLGSASSIALLASQLADTTALGFNLICLSILCFAVAVFLGLSALTAQAKEQMELSGRLMTAALDTYKDWSSPENMKRVVAGEPLSVRDFTPSFELKQTRNRFSWAHGWMTGGGVLALIYLFIPTIAALYDWAVSLVQGFRL